MRTGPPPKPTKLRLLEGNPSRRPINDREPQPANGEPWRPPWLEPAAKREWTRIVPYLRRLGLVTVVDGAALAAYCQSYARWRQADMLVKEKGLTFKSPNGQLAARPEIGISQRERALMRSFLTEFGLTPASRTRLTVAEKAEDDLEELLRS